MSRFCHGQRLRYTAGALVSDWVNNRRISFWAKCRFFLWPTIRRMWFLLFDGGDSVRWLYKYNEKGRKQHEECRRD